MTTIATVNVHTNGSIAALDARGMEIPGYVGRRRELIDRVLADAPLNTKWYSVGSRGGRKRIVRPGKKAGPRKFQTGKEEPPTRVGRILNDLMKKNHMSSLDVHRLTGMSRNHIANILGGWRLGTAVSVMKICQAFDLNQEERLVLSNAAAQDYGFHTEAGSEQRGNGHDQLAASAAGMG